MMARPRLRFLLAGIALILVTNAVALVGVAYNRSGDPDSVLQLTQRELRLPYNAGYGGENSGIALALQWRTLGVGSSESAIEGMGYASFTGPPAWLDSAKLAALGFDMNHPQAVGVGHHKQQLPREVLLVLEFDGAAYRQALERARQRVAREEAVVGANPGREEFKQRATMAKEALLREEGDNSRLFAIDAGLDAESLRAKFPDRRKYPIVRGQVRVQQVGSAEKSRLAGYVSNLSVGQINVPLAFYNAFEATPGGRANAASHYRVTVAFGKRLEPWITAASATRAAQ
jgi:hypothetical protein